MRVLQIITGLSVGGAETLLYDICRESINTVCIVYLTKPAPLAVKFKGSGIRTLYVESGNVFAAVFKLLKIMKAFKPDVVHTHLPKADSLGRLAALLHRFIHNRGLRIVATMHNEDEWKRDKSPKFAALRAFNRIIVNCIKNSSLIAVSEAVRGHCIKYEGILPTKIVALRNFVKYDESKRTGKTALPAEGAFTVLNVGRLTRQKNQIELLRAAKALPDIRFVLAGDGEYREKLERYAESNGLKNVVFAGFVGNIYDYYDACGLVVSTSLYEGLAGAILEAAMNRRLVLASDISSSREIIENGKTGLLYELGNIQMLADRISEVRDGKYDISKMIEAQFAEVSKLNIESYLKELNNIYLKRE